MPDRKWYETSEDMLMPLPLTEEEAKVLTINMKEYELVPGLRSGLIGVRSGEECQILFTGKYGFGNKAFGTIPANSPLVYRIWVESISND